MSEKVEDILLYEVRELRKDLKKHTKESHTRDKLVHERINELDKKVYANKIKFGAFMAFVSYTFSLIGVNTPKWLMKFFG